MERKLSLPSINLLDKHEGFASVCVCEIFCNVADDLLFFSQNTVFLVPSLQICFGELSHTHVLLWCY